MADTKDSLDREVVFCVTEVPHKSRSRTKDGATTRINRKLINYKSITTLWITTKLKMCTGSIEI
jgi:hypothetical protein